MHELSLCRSISVIAERAAAGREVTTIHLDVGELRQVVPETLTYCWTIVREDTALADSVLCVNQIPAVIACDDCQAQTRMRGIPILVCGSCGSGHVAVVTGEEFLLRSLDVRG
ncbi:hydrogenase maturation nickel metallochaperone HypA [Gordonia sp. PP30]|uniref:hydrogenase maturation nickel metallochaperone HypA n=1 Tax=Gordonia sp. PP30 TaxID=2935861 RepID=UPI001FFEA7CD|nr:hydrogenase maturation nickel metallochaperone HypA [Gordonia sp. PP30]UQE76465.1 hydrogenase maturation nickel metallochaperone HypA [Gordonia sp. PP30]